MSLSASEQALIYNSFTSLLLSLLCRGKLLSAVDEGGCILIFKVAVLHALERL